MATDSTVELDAWGVLSRGIAGTEALSLEVAHVQGWTFVVPNGGAIELRETYHGKSSNDDDKGDAT